MEELNRALTNRRAACGLRKGCTRAAQPEHEDSTSTKSCCCACVLIVSISTHFNDLYTGFNFSHFQA